VYRDRSGRIVILFFSAQVEFEIMQGNGFTFDDSIQDGKGLIYARNDLQCVSITPPSQLWAMACHHCHLAA